MDPQGYANVALVGVIAKVTYSVAKSWWYGKTIKQKCIEAAEMEAKQVDYGLYCELEAEDVIVAAQEHLAQPDRITKRAKHGLFKSYLVQQGKVKFGTPKRSAANLLVVRKYLHDICVDSGLIARHILEHLDIATELVFIPSKQEIIAMAVSHTRMSKDRNELKREFGCVQADIA